MALLSLILDRIRTGGPMTVAEYMALALYHPELGYYATAAQRSGRAGDFYTSVDVGPLFGEMLAMQFEEMWRLLDRPPALTLVEAAAGNGRLARDVLDAAAASPAFYASLAVHLVETSEPARRAQRDTLGPHADKLAAAGAQLPEAVTGVIFANELLDALPVHLVVMREDGLREVHVTEQGGLLREIDGPLSTPAIAEYLARAGARLEPGWRAEIGLAADAWVRDAARRLSRGFLAVIDYGHDARDLYSAAHAGGTLRTFQRHTTDPSDRAWLDEPGARDLTAHVNLTTVRQTAVDEGLVELAALDQTYFLLGLGAAERAMRETRDPVADLKRRLAMKTLFFPGGLGGSHKVLIFGRDVGHPTLACTGFRARLT